MCDSQPTLAQRHFTMSDDIPKVLTLPVLQEKAKQIQYCNGDITHLKIVKDGVACQKMHPGDEIAACDPLLIMPYMPENEINCTLMFGITELASLEWIENVLEIFKNLKDLENGTSVSEIINTGDDREKRNAVWRLAYTYLQRCPVMCGARVWYPPYYQRLRKNDLKPTVAVFDMDPDTPFKMTYEVNERCRDCNIHCCRQLFVAQRRIDVGDVLTINTRDPFVPLSLNDPHPATVDPNIPLFFTMEAAFKIVKSIEIPAKEDTRYRKNSLWPCIADQKQMAAIRILSREVMLQTKNTAEVMKIFSQILAIVMSSIDWPHYPLEVYYQLLMMRTNLYKDGSIYNGFSRKVKEYYSSILFGLEIYLGDIYGVKNFTVLFKNYMNLMNFCNEHEANRIPK